MKTVVVCYSKSGNTKTIAEAMSQATGAMLLPLNLAKKGRKTKEEKELESHYFEQALYESKDADCVIIGTPTEFRKPHPRVMEFVAGLETKKVAIFCTYYGMLGATFYDLEALLLQRGITLVDKLNLIVGTEKYSFKQDIGRYKELITPAHLQAAQEFALNALGKQEALQLRLRGICGRDCTACAHFNKTCKGAGYGCWSERHCQVFDCCVIKKSYLSCSECNSKLNCSMNKQATA